MKVLSYKDITVSKDDDFLYTRLMELLQQIKLTQGGTALDSTLRRHSFLRNYCMAKQFEKIDKIEKTYFCENGSLDQIAIENYHFKNSSLQNVKVKVY